MSKRVLCLFAVALLLGAEPPSEAAKKDLDKMQGEWKVEKAQRAGQDAPAEVRDKMTLKFDGNSVSVSEGGAAREEKATISLDPSKKPAAIDIKPMRPGQEEIVAGIYKIEGEMLSICWAKSGGARPTEFATKAGTEQVLFVLKRAKK